MSEPRWRRYSRFLRPSVEGDIDDEMAFHFRMRVEQFMRDGLSREDAERRAREQFGDMSSARTEMVGIGKRSARRADWRDRWGSVWQDAVVGARALRREPTFALGVMLTLGIGLGANATMFGVVDGLMLRGPDHVVNATRVDRLYLSTHDPVRGDETRSSTGYVTYVVLRDHAKSLAAVAAYTGAYDSQLGSGWDAKQVALANATWDLFPTLGVRPVAGRFYGADEDHPPTGSAVAVIGERLWRSQFGGDQSIVGRTISIRDHQYRVVGVAPEGFNGADRQVVDVWLPMSLSHPRPDWWTTYSAQWLRVVVRLAPGATAARASAEATSLLRASYAGPNPVDRQAVASFRPLWYSNAGTPSPVAKVSVWLLGVSLTLLFIVAANVANLLLARTARRRHEMAVRVALGIGRFRLLRLLSTETLLLTGGGIAFGLGLGWLGGRLMRATLLSDIAWSQPVIDPRVALATSAVGLCTGLVLALFPAWQGGRSDVTSGLKAGERDGGGRRQLIRSSLAVVQSALSLVLLTGAALFVDSLNRVRNVDLGFEPEKVLRVWVSFKGLPADWQKANVMQTPMYKDVVARVAQLPSVAFAALAVGTPWGAGFSDDVFVSGFDSLPKMKGGGPFESAISPGYFATLGATVRRGRDFTAADRAGSDPVAIVSDLMARTLWPNQEVLGKCFRISKADAPCARIVGIVPVLHRQNVREDPAMQYYIPLGQEAGISGTAILVRAKHDVTETQRDLETLFRSRPDIVRAQTDPLMSTIDPEFRPWQLGASMFGAFGVLAVIVAAIGLYSLIAYQVADKTREIGVRIALGATGGRIVRHIVASGMATTLIGIALGVVAVMATGRFIEPLLFDERAVNSGILLGVGSALVVFAAIASMVPAFRATRIDPIRALRAD
jgi:predicted permease